MELLKKISDTAKERFADIPFPHKKDEYWRFADLKAWSVDALFPHFSSQIASRESIEDSAYTQKMRNLEKAFEESDASVLLSDGQIISANLPEGVVAMSFSVAEEECPELVENFFSNCKGKFDTLQASRPTAGVVLRVNEGAKVNLNLAVVSKLPLSTAGVLVDIGAGASLKLKRASLNYAGSFGVLRVAYNLGKGSSLELASVKMAEENAHCYEREDFFLGENSRVRDALAQVGKSPSRHERNFELSAQNIDLDTRVFLSISGDLTHDLRTLQNHTSPSSKSNLAVKAAIFDNASLAFAGLINVTEAAQKTEAYQSCRSLLLSDKARAQATPVLEISANDVACSHGCAVSKPDEDQLFYMRQRGLSLSEARSLIVGSFAQTTFAEIEDKAFVESLMELIF